MRSARNERRGRLGSCSMGAPFGAILFFLTAAGPAGVHAQGPLDWTPTPTETPSRGAQRDEEAEEAKGSPELATARKAIREGRVDDGLSLLRGLRARGDRRPAVAYWMGVAYQKLGLLELAWRELNLAALYQPQNHTYENALRTVERDIAEGPQPSETPTEEPSPNPGSPTPTPAESEGTPTPAMTPTQTATPTVTSTPEPVDEVLDGLRIRAERAFRAGHFRLAVGLAQRCLARKADADDIRLFAVDACLRDGAVAQARQLFDAHPQAKDPELSGLRTKLEAAETAGKPYKPEGTDLDRATAAIDRLFLDDARELLERQRIQSPKDPQVLILLARVYALRGEAAAAIAFAQEAAFGDARLNRFVDRPELLQEAPLRLPHQQLFEPQATTTPGPAAATPQAPG